MRNIPFCSVEEAKANAALLCRTLEFYSVRIPNPAGGEPIDIGLQRTQQLMAKSFGFTRWEDLTSILVVGTQARYFDMRADRDAVVRALATRFAHLLGVADFDRIEPALLLSEFGCTLNTRKEARDRLQRFPQTVEQWRQLHMLQAGYLYNSRYDQGRSAYEIAMLRWDHEKNVAKVLGTTIPRKPHEPRATKVT